MIRLVRNTLIAVGVLVLLITLTPIVKWTAEAMRAPWGKDDGPVLVVLGGDMLVPGTGPNAMLGYDTYLRCVMAVWMARQVKYRYIVVTGAWGLSQSMERFLISQGVPKELILQENAAESTHENAVFTKRILARVYGGNLPRIVVLTSDFHSRRALLTFQRAGFIHCSAIPAPDVIKRCSTRAYRLHGAETVAIELFALAYYKLKGYA